MRTSSDRRAHLLLIAALASVFAAPPSLAAQAASAPAGAPETLVLDGLEIEFDESNDWVRMYSTYRQPVSFPDRAGIRKAYTIAEEKGKAQIIRFFRQNVTSGRLIEEVNSEAQTAVRRQVNGSDSVSRTTQREMVESIREFTSSYSEGTLRGVTVVEQGYDEVAEEVWVKVGLSRTTMRLGAQMQQEMANPRGASGTARDSSKKPMTQPSEVRSRRIP